MRVLSSLIVAAVAVGATTAAYATPIEITQIGTVTAQTTDINPGVAYTITTSPYGNLGSTTFDAFNTELGTLKSVSVTITNSATSSGTLTNTSGSTQSFTFGLSLDAYVTSGPASLLSTFGQFDAGDTTFQSPKFSYSSVPNAGVVNFPKTGTNAFTASGGVPPTTSGSGSPLSYSASLNPSDFLSNFTVDFGTLGGSTLTGGPTLGKNILTQAGSTLEVDYFYTTASTVPEPSSLALFGAGLAGLAFFARRRSSK